MTPEDISKRVKAAKAERERPIFHLSEKHQKAAKIIYENNTLPRYKFKRVCKRCQGKRFEGATRDGLLVPCSRCVNIDSARSDWAAYVGKLPELKAGLISIGEFTEGGK